MPRPMPDAAMWPMRPMRVRCELGVQDLYQSCIALELDFCATQYVSISQCHSLPHASKREHALCNLSLWFSSIPGHISVPLHIAILSVCLHALVWLRTARTVSEVRKICLFVHKIPRRRPLLPREEVGYVGEFKGAVSVWGHSDLCALTTYCIVAA